MTDTAQLLRDIAEALGRNVLGPSTSRRLLERSRAALTDGCYAVEVDLQGEKGPEQFVLAEPWATKELWTYVIGPFDTGDAAKAHAKKYRISAHSVRSLIRP